MSSNRFYTDSASGDCYIEVEDDHIYVGGWEPGMFTDMAEVAALRDELTRFLERNVSQR